MKTESAGGRLKLIAAVLNLTSVFPRKIPLFTVNTCNNSHEYTNTDESSTG